MNRCLVHADDKVFALSFLEFPVTVQQSKSFSHEISLNNFFWRKDVENFKN